MEIGLLTALLIAVGGGLWWDRHSQKAYTRRLADAWARERRVIAPPIGVICRGDRPSVLGRDTVLGALGAADDRVIFAGQRRADYNLDAPLAWLRWIGLGVRVKVSWNRRIEYPLLRLHFETPDGWRAYTFSDGPVEETGRAIARAAGLRLEEIGEAHEDFGPAPTVYRQRDPSGRWVAVGPAPFELNHIPPAWDGMTQTLYLAPGRLLYNWRSLFPLDALHRVDVFAPGDAENPFAQHLLRVEYGEDHTVAAFALFNAGDWAGVLERRSRARVVHHGPRQGASERELPGGS